MQVPYLSRGFYPDFKKTEKHLFKISCKTTRTKKETTVMIDDYRDNTFKVVEETFVNNKGEQLTVEKHYRKQARGNFYKTHKIEIMDLCKVIGGSKGKVMAYLVEHLNFTDNTVKVTHNKIVKDTGVSYAAVSNVLAELEHAGLLKMKTGYLMISPGLMMRGDLRKEHMLEKAYRDFYEDEPTKYPKSIILPSIIDTNSEILILSSFPIEGDGPHLQYYADSADKFWELIFSCLGEEVPTDYAEKTALLLKNNIALWTVMHIMQPVRAGTLQRQFKPNDFQKLLKNYPNIKTIVFNGDKAFQLFKKSVPLKDFPDIKTLKMPTTSPSRGRYVKTYEEKLNEWNSLIKE